MTTSAEEFLRMYSLPSDALETTGLDWQDLLSINSHHQSKVEKLEVHARSIVEQLRTVREVHSLRYRVKSPEHLIAKIIRKKLDRPDFTATAATYRDTVTDLVGIPHYIFSRMTGFPSIDSSLRRGT